MIVLHKLHATVLTDQGKVRTNNEDNFYFDGKGYEEPQAFCHFSEKCSTRKKPIFAVFDGMGGESYGEIASSLAVQTLRQHEKAIKHCKSEQLDAVVQEFVADANQNIYQMAKKLQGGNSGTTTRLISGILAGQNFSSTLTGDASIQKRPMGRIINPLTQMGASIRSIPENGCAPLAINGHPLHAISYLSPVASAQVKSCVLLAGLYADGKTSVTEPALSRNHTELMLKFFGADVASEGLTASVLPDPDLHGNLVRVPGDISSAAYFIAAALIVPGSEVLLKNVGINPTRDGMLRVCRAMGADITLLNEQNSGGEPVADLLVRYTPSLSGTVIEGELIPTLIDEIPIIAVLAATANGTTVIRNAEELKVKESNRLDIMVNELTAMGVSLEGTDDGMIIEGGKPFHGAQIDSRLDHRIAMSFAIASLAAETPTEILRAGCVDISYPTFYQDLAQLQA